MDEESAGGEIQIPVIWVERESLNVQYVNQFLTQLEGDEIFLDLGTLTPPVILGETPEEQRQQAERIGFVPVRTVTRVAMSRRRLAELIELLQRTAIRYDATTKGQQE